MIPAAADDQYVSVLFRSGRDLEPRCISRQLRPAPYHTTPFRGRESRLRIPHNIARNPQGRIRLRDGDCLHADVGPYGPPAPEPVRSAASRTSVVALGLCLGVRRLDLALLITLARLRSGVATPRAAQPPARTVSRDIHPVALGCFPWRHQPDEAMLSEISGRRPCRCMLWCPWNGPQGACKCLAGVTVTQLRVRFSSAMLASSEICPVWPSSRLDSVNFVPAMGRASTVVCVLARQHSKCRAILLPRQIGYEDLLRGVFQCTGWAASQVRLPPALHAQRRLCPTDPIHCAMGTLLTCLVVEPTLPRHRLVTSGSSRTTSCGHGASVSAALPLFNFGIQASALRFSRG